MSPPSKLLFPSRSSPSCRQYRANKFLTHGLVFERDFPQRVNKSWVERTPLIFDFTGFLLLPKSASKAASPSCESKRRLVTKSALAADQPLGDAARDRHLERLAVAEASMPVFREGRVIEYIASQTQPAEPAIGKGEMHLAGPASLAGREDQKQP